MLKIALVGCGRISERHVQGYRELKDKGFDDFVITALYDPVIEGVKKIRREIRLFQEAEVQICSTFDSAIDSAEAVDICTPTHTHHTLAVKGIKSGKNIMVEKPLGITVRAARNIVRESRRTKKVLAVAENYRRRLENRAIKWIIEEGLIGELQAVIYGGMGRSQISSFEIGSEIGWGKNYVIAGSPWHHDKTRSGAGCILDNGVHDADLFRYLGGEVSKVFGVSKVLEPVRVTKGERRKRKVWNNASDFGCAILNHENGTVCNWVPSYWAGHGRGAPLIQWFYGSEGCIQGSEVFFDNGTQSNITDLFLSNADDKLLQTLFPLSIRDPYALELYDFMDSILHDRDPETDGVEGLKAEAISYSVIESSQVNRSVKVKDVEQCRVEEYQKEINEKLGIK